MAVFTCATCGEPVGFDGWCGRCDPGRPGGHPAEDLRTAGLPATSPPDDEQIPDGGSTPARTA